jgi:type III pantothenate kinase
MTLLALDIGNSRLKWTLYDSTAMNATVLGHGAEFLDHVDTLAEGVWARLTRPDLVIGCNVAGDPVRRRVSAQLELWDAPVHWVHASASEAGVVNGYDHPIRLGADRWVALIGASAHLRAKALSGPAVVVMVGTAVTVDALSAEGRFLGGFILPGHGMMQRSLESGTAGLRVPTGHVMAFPTNTSDALTSGGTFAIAGAVERMMQQVELVCLTPPICLMAGGAAWKIAPYMNRPVEPVDHLIFTGLLEVAQHRFGSPEVTPLKAPHP